MILAGCSTVDSGGAATDSQPAGNTAYTTPRTMPSGKGSDESDGVFPRTVKHFEGSTRLEAAPKRVVVISTGQADALLTLGVVPVASTAGDAADLVPSYLADAFPDRASALADVRSIGNRFAPDVETIAAVQPDLILMNTAGKDADTLYSSLAKIAPTVATRGTGRYWKQDFLLLADALGKTQQAETWLTTYQEDARTFGEGVQGNPTVSFLRYNSDRLRVFGVASFPGSVAEDAGLVRPVAQDFTNGTSQDISSEQLALADSDFVYAGVQGGDTKKLTSLALWPTLEAVGRKRVTFIDDDVFYLNTGPTAARRVLAELGRTAGL
ncbi:iron-siderophore ABC transporter substrate-binding protein [Curtobacterium sp. VKM Ac-1393]|uniref:iron-siderophore ABC transporter substrate-binding protein n=1 Tax=Curtobacterium sp. VKM Ac-1393 TaxID=2783814 RepID=UPI002B27BF3C|nr:iron-siderophore ABC transporter substrate-binding protein [Curtobacterium sp. VKM Ac-1393]